MEHQFTIPARVVEVTDEAPREVDPDTEELLPPAPAATDDGTPVNRPPEATAAGKHTRGAERTARLRLRPYRR
jgi:hypothetical protein